MGARLTDSAAYAPPVGHRRDPRHVRRATRGWQRVARHPRRAGRRAGRARHHPASSADDDRRAGAGRAPRPRPRWPPRRGARRTPPSGLIPALQAILPDDAAEHVYYGVTVQDLTDTWIGAGDPRRRWPSSGATCARWSACSSTWPRSHRAHGDGRADARPARRADHVRLQGWRSWADELGRHLRTSATRAGAAGRRCSSVVPSARSGSTATSGPALRAGVLPSGSASPTRASLVHQS